MPEWLAFVVVLGTLALGVHVIVAAWYRFMGWPSTRAEFDRQREQRTGEILDRHAR